MGNNTIEAAKKITAANKGQMSQAMIIQQYANSVKEQPNVDFSKFKNLVKYQNEINNGLKTAQIHADNYLNTIQPNMIQNIANIGNYYALHNAVQSTLPPGSTERDWLMALRALEDQAKAYEADAHSVVITLQTLTSNLSTDSANFAKIVLDLNSAVNGDNGVIAGINKNLSKIQGQIDGAIAGTVLSGLAIVGGIFMVAVGGIGEIFTGGASTALIVGGIAVVAVGVGGEIASALILKNLNDEKAKLISQKANLKAEVKLATGMSSGYGSLNKQVKSAVDAATSMKNAWGFLSSDLGTMADDLNKGIINTGYLRKVFLTGANTEVKTVITDINTIKTQMAGVHKVTVAPGQTVGDAIVDAAHKQAA